MADGINKRKRNSQDVGEEESSTKRRRPMQGGLSLSTLQSSLQPAKDSPIDTAKRLLFEKSGHQDFRCEQEAAIRAVLDPDCHNTLVVFAPGAGKSLCYQIPAIAFPVIDAEGGADGVTTSGLTLVISPLISVMLDQVDGLKKRGIAAAAMHSHMSNKERREIFQAIHDDKLRILYCPLERTNSEFFVESMKAVPGGVRLLAIDGAHCISEVWQPLDSPLQSILTHGRDY